MNIFLFKYPGKEESCLKKKKVVWIFLDYILLKTQMGDENRWQIELLQCFSVSELVRGSELTYRISSALTLPKMSLLRTLDWPTLAWQQATPLLAARPRTRFSLSTKEALLCILPLYKYTLRNPKSMEVPLCSTSAHLSSFLPSCSILWNTLPASVTSCSSLSSFASSLDSLFVDDKFSYGLPP